MRRKPGEANSVMAKSPRTAKAREAWNRIEALGGHGVWESDIVVVSLAGTSLTDEGLALFADFPLVQVLDLSETNVGDKGLARLADLPALEELILVNTRVSRSAIEAYRRDRPSVVTRTQPVPKGSINPFTGEPL